MENIDFASLLEEAVQAIEKMNTHINIMAGQMAQYLEPGGYKPFNCAPILLQQEEIKDEMFISDMIYLLDGPEQRAVQDLAEGIIHKYARL